MLTDAAQVRDTMMSLIEVGHGNFEFERYLEAELGKQMVISIEGLLLGTAAVDELEAYKPQLSAKDLPYISAGPVDMWLDDPFDFWQRSDDLLATGSSASEIAAGLATNLERIQYFLHKLQLLGKVMPLRD